MRIFDTHAHYDSSAFASDRDEILTALPQAGVELVVDPGCDVESSRAALPWPSGIPMYTPRWGCTRRTAPEPERRSWRKSGGCAAMKRRWPSGRSAWITIGRKIRPALPAGDLPAAAGSGPGTGHAGHCP